MLATIVNTKWESCGNGHQKTRIASRETGKSFVEYIRDNYSVSFFSGVNKVPKDIGRSIWTSEGTKWKTYTSAATAPRIGILKAWNCKNSHKLEMYHQIDATKFNYNVSYHINVTNWSFNFKNKIVEVINKE